MQTGIILLPTLYQLNQPREATLVIHHFERFLILPPVKKEQTGNEM
jgi:hypothetical protein